MTYRHGMTETKLYRAWMNMRQRCSNPKDTAYRYYGGRGIRVCDEWQRSSLAFIQWALTHGYDEGLTIDRIDPDGDYIPENCRWVTFDFNRMHQRHSLGSRGSKRYQFLIACNGNFTALSRISKEIGISRHIVSVIKQELATPLPHVANMLAGIFGMTPEKLFGSTVIPVEDFNSMYALRRARIDCRLLPSTVAKSVGISARRYGRIEAGYDIPPEDIKSRIACFLNSTVETLFGKCTFGHTDPATVAE